MPVGGDGQDGGGRETMGVVFGMGVWGLDPVSKPAIGGTISIVKNEWATASGRN